MPGKRITFIVIPQNDGQVREFGLSTRILWSGALACALLAALFGHYALHFHTRADQGRDLAVLIGQVATWRSSKAGPTCSRPGSTRPVATCPTSRRS